MAEYKKYLFDDLVIGEKKSDNGSSSDDTPIAAETENTLDTDDVNANEEANFAEDVASPDDDYIQPQQPPEPSYNQEDLDEAVKKAYDEAYAKGKEEALAEANAAQNELLNEIKNQLSLIFVGLDGQLESMEEDGLRFFTTCLRKVLPTIDSTVALPELKKFLQDNFANLRNQKTLAFFLAPDMAKSVAPLIEKVAEQNDFEGKISIHKDENLSASDCRIEWKDGYVERDVAKLLDKIDELLANNQ